MSTGASDQPLDLLAGVKILSFTQFLLGPAAVQYLGDMGADIIKIETPGSGAWERSWSGADTFRGGESIFYLLNHRNVRSLTLNLKSPEGQEVARRLAEDADVLVQNFRPGVMERFGLGYEQISKINPRIIYAVGSGYGMDSPYRDLPGQDLLIQALSGLMQVTGQRGQPPTAAGAAVVDQHAASLLAMGILAALLYRDRTGKGQQIEVTMLQAALDLQLEPLTYHMNGGNIQRPQEQLASSFHPAPYGTYETQDGYIVLSLSPITSIRSALGGPEELAPFEDAAIAFEQRDEIRRVLDPFFRTKSSQEWLQLLGTYGVWCAPVNDYEQLLASPAVQYLEPTVQIEHPRAGRVHLLKHPVRYGIGEPQIERVPPALGQDTDGILAGLGYSPEEIEHLRTQRTI